MCITYDIYLSIVTLDFMYIFRYVNSYQNMFHIKVSAQVYVTSHTLLKVFPGAKVTMWAVKSCEYISSSIVNCKD